MEELLCIGCGIKLQCEDENAEGYVNPNAFNRSFILCKRCYQLKHYGRFVESSMVKNTINLIHQSTKKDDLIVLISDVAFVDTPLIKTLKELNSFENVVLVCNRYDLYKDYISVQKLSNFIKREINKSQINFKKFFIINDNFDEIFDYLSESSIKHDIYLVGLENAGKTTFLNNILKRIANERDNFLTDSKYPGTTVDLIKIPLDEDSFFVDSPGIRSKGNILHFVDLNFIKRLNGDNKIKSTIFQINSGQSLIVSNLVKLDIIEAERQSVVFYGSSLLELMRCKYENSKKTFNNNLKTLKFKTSKVCDLSTLEMKSFKINNGKTDIVIEGLGFFTVTNGSYNIYVPKGVNIYLRAAMI